MWQAAQEKIFGITFHCSFEDGNMLEITTPPPPPHPDIKGKEMLKEKEKQRGTRQILVLPRRALTQVSLVLKQQKVLTNDFLNFVFIFQNCISLVFFEQ